MQQSKKNRVIEYRATKKKRDSVQDKRTDMKKNLKTKMRSVGISAKFLSGTSPKASFLSSTNR